MLLEENLDENTPQIIVENEIRINRNSEVTLTKVFLKGRLNVYDDSLLTFKGETTFSNDSIIDINFKNQQKQGVNRSLNSMVFWILHLLKSS